MKRTLAVLLAVLMIFGCAALTACNKTGLVNDRDDAQIISADEIADTMTSKDGKYEIAMVTNVGRLKDKSFNQGTWDGVKTFAYQNGKSYKYYQPRNGNKASDDDRYNAFIEAISGGAKIIVATGYEQEKALKRAAAENPDTKFVFVDGYVLTDGNGKTLSNVAAVSFMEEQCGYLAGYAAVTEGYTALGFVGTREVPGIVRYATGFLQGAEAAAEQQGERVSLQTWFTDTDTVNDAITQRMIDWYNNGTTLIMVSGGDLYTGVANAVNQTGAKAITTDCDRTDQGDRILASAVKCYNAAVQRELYTFFVQGTWDAQSAGQTEKTGFTNGEVALQAGSQWRLDNFSQESYRKLYEKLRTSALRVDTYSDLDTLPDTPNVTLTRLR